MKEQKDREKASEREGRYVSQKQPGKQKGKKEGINVTNDRETACGLIVYLVAS